MIEVDKVSKALGKKTVLQEITFNIEKGSIFGLMGENGAGKTTLVRCMTGIYRTDSGSIRVNGSEVYENPDIKRNIGYVAEQSQYFSSFYIKELISFYKMTYPSFSEDKFHRLNKVLEVPVEKRMMELSKGMKMRVSLMLNLSINPEFLVLDEPTSGLDAAAKREVFRLILEDVEERRTTVFISSHGLHDIERFCDRVALLKGSKIHSIGSVEAMKKNIRKLQVVFKEELPECINTWREVVSVEKLGRVFYIITREYTDELEKKFYSHGAMFIEEIDMSLEDMFIYSAKGVEKIDEAV